MYSKEQLELAEIMIERNLSKLYVEVYKKPTGFSSIDEMKEHIAKCNKIIGNREEEIGNMLYRKVREMTGWICLIPPPTVTIKQYYQQLTDFYNQCI